ncbi:MAG: phosphohydrolase, partial [Deltaproteobacteria bacterium]|nr:phosphohydrolase [Deltaproteobacteria bacterium]
MKCPGQDSRYWKPEAIFKAKCPKCGHNVEFFKDDTTRKCDKCGHKFANPKMDFGCAAYCQFAEECIGTLP